VPRLDHVVLNVGSEAVLRAENGGQTRLRMRGEPIGDVAELPVARRRIAHNPHARAVEGGRRQEALGPENDWHSSDYRHA